MICLEWDNENYLFSLSKISKNIELKKLFTFAKYYDINIIIILKEEIERYLYENINLFN